MLPRFIEGLIWIAFKYNEYDAKSPELRTYRMYAFGSHMVFLIAFIGLRIANTHNLNELNIIQRLWLNVEMSSKVVEILSLLIRICVLPQIINDSNDAARVHVELQDKHEEIELAEGGDKVNTDPTDKEEINPASENTFGTLQVRDSID